MSLAATMKIAVILSAYDKMSSVVNNATNNAQRKMKDLMNKSFVEGGMLLGAGEKLAGVLTPAIESFGQLQEAQNNLKASMMGPGGMMDEKTFKKISDMSMDLSDKYAGTSSSYLDMVAVLKNNRINESDILGGIGESTAKLADLFQMMPSEIAEFSAHMKNDMGVLPAQMGQMMDTIARIHNAGVGKTGSEAVMEMNEFFSKASLGAANLGVQGVEATKKLGALGALFMSRGLSGQSVGTNFRRIFDGLRDAKKVEKATQVAREFGVQLKFFDKGKFLGIDNFISQIGKMKNLSPQSVQAIFKAFGGKQGLSTDFLEYLGKNGVAGYAEFNKKLADQATLSEKLNVVMGGLNYIIKVMKTSFTNLQAVFGSTIGPSLKVFYTLMNKIIVAVRHFLQQNPLLGEIVSTFVALASAALMIAGVIKIIQGIKIAFALLNLTMAVNPFVLLGIAVVEIIYLIVTHWDKVKAFFINLWNNIKRIFNATWTWIKNMFLNYTPEGLIIKHWAKIAGFFRGMWKLIKSIFLSGIVWLSEKFNAIVSFVFSLGKRFYDAGANIINSVIKGITSKVTYLVDKVKNVAAKIRGFFPFSPAKEGPLKDIHRIKLIETIAQNIKPNLLVNKMSAVARSVANVGGQEHGNNGGGSFSPTFHIHLSGGATKADGDMISSRIKKEMELFMKQHNNQRDRLSFG